MSPVYKTTMTTCHLYITHLAQYVTYTHNTPIPTCHLHITNLGYMSTVNKST